MDAQVLEIGQAGGDVFRMTSKMTLLIKLFCRWRLCLVDEVVAADAAGFSITKRQSLTKTGVVAKNPKLKTVFRNRTPGDDY